jgi:hypothetical protein
MLRLQDLNEEFITVEVFRFQHIETRTKFLDMYVIHNHKQFYTSLFTLSISYCYQTNSDICTARRLTQFYSVKEMEPISRVFGGF